MQGQGSVPCLLYFKGLVAEEILTSDYREELLCPVLKYAKLIPSMQAGGNMILYPKEEFGSTYQIPFDEFYEQGYRGIIFDIDNTLVPHGAPADDRSKKLCAKLKSMGYQVCLLSNNKEPRVKPFADALEVQYLCPAGKPGKKGYLKAAELMGLSGEQILFVGDQLLTDVAGANGVKYYSILVAPINPKEEIQIVLKRILERIILFFYHRSKTYKGTRPNRKNFEENIPEEYR